MTQLESTCRATLPTFGQMDGATPMNFANSTDESLLAFYESVRRQVAADSQLGGRYRLIGARVRQYADELVAEMDRRRLRFRPIEWS